MLSVVLGRRGAFVACWNVGAQAGCFNAAFGYMRARLVFWGSGASGMGANAVDKTSTLFCFQSEGAPLLAALKGLNNSWRRRYVLVHNVRRTRNQDWRWRGDLKNKGKGELSIHFCGDDNTAQYLRSRSGHVRRTGLQGNLFLRTLQRSW